MRVMIAQIEILFFISKVLISSLQLLWSRWMTDNIFGKYRI
jgi:uncharacterized membrane protein